MAEVQQSDAPSQLSEIRADPAVTDAEWPPVAIDLESGREEQLEAGVADRQENRPSCCSSASYRATYSKLPLVFPRHDDRGPGCRYVSDE